jgi:hypothetical protein
MYQIARRPRRLNIVLLAIDGSAIILRLIRCPWHYGKMQSGAKARVRIRGGCNFEQQARCHQPAAGARIVGCAKQRSERQSMAFFN